MARSNLAGVPLDADDLNRWDILILEYLSGGRATPELVRKMAEQDGKDGVTRQYINQRMARLAEHEHLDNVLGTGVYELVDDPRE